MTTRLSNAVDFDLLELLLPSGRKISGPVDLRGHQIVNASLGSLVADPSPLAGSIYFNASHNTLRASDGTTWGTDALAAGTDIPAGGSQGQVIVKTSNTDHDVAWGGQSVGTPTLSLPLDSLSDWSVANGTWAIVGDVLQLSTSGQDTTCVLRLNQRIATPLCVVQVEGRVVSGANANQRFSVGIAAPSNGGAGWPVAHFTTSDNGSTWHAQADQMTTTVRGVSAAIPGITGYGTWVTLKVLYVGDAVSVYVDGAHIANFTNTNSTANGYENSWIALSGRNSLAEFRNLKVWGAEKFLGGVI